MYSIGQASNMFHLPISTLRYYGKEGLFPGLTRISDVRKFSENEPEGLPDRLPEEIQRLYDHAHGA